MPGASSAPSFIRITIGVTTIEQVSGVTVFRCTGNTDPGFQTGDTATISGCSVADYNTDHQVTGTGTDGTGAFVKLGFTTHIGNATGGQVLSQPQPIVDMIGKQGTAGVQIIKSGTQHLLLLLEGGQGGGGGGGGGSNTLDLAYDQGGAGAGRTINATSGAVTIATPHSSGSGSLLVTSEEGSQTPVVINHTDTSGGSPLVTAPALFVASTRLNAANVEIMDVQGAVAPSTSADKLFTVYGSETVVNDAKVDHDFRAECLASVANGPHTVSNSLVHEASTGRLGLGIANPGSALHIKHKGNTAGIQVTATEVSSNNPYFTLESTYPPDQKGSGSNWKFDIVTNPTYTNTGASIITEGFNQIVSSGYIITSSQAAAGQPAGNFSGWLHRMDSGFSVGDIDVISPVDGSSATIGEHAGTAGVHERSLVVGRDSNATDSSVSIGTDCTAMTNSLAVGEAADTTGYPNAPVIAMNNGSSTGGGTGSTPNTVVIDSGNQAPSGALALGGGGGNGNVYLEAGVFASGAADYAEMFEWADGNSKNKPQNAVDRRGLFVHLEPGSSSGLQDSMKIAVGYLNSLKTGVSPPIGVVSGRPIILGDAGELQWTQAHEVDDFGATKYNTVKGKKVPKPNPNFNSNKTYLPRSQRVEWCAVGLLGKLFVRTSSAALLQAGDYVMPDPNTGMAVKSVVAGKFQSPHEAHQSGTEFHYPVLRVMRQATQQQFGIVEILLK